MPSNSVTLTVPPLNFDPTMGGKLMCFANYTAWQRVTFSGLFDLVCEGAGPAALSGGENYVIAPTGAETTLTILFEYSPTGEGGPYLPSEVVWWAGPVEAGENILQSFDTAFDAQVPGLSPFQPPEQQDPEPSPTHNGANVNLMLYFQ